MLSAVDPITDTLVFADVASRSRHYRCPRCKRPVVLRAGSVYAAHFKHVIGQADPDCENYFASAFQYSGLRRVVSPANEGRDTSDTFDLYFDFAPSGAQLGVWLPSSRETGNWTGGIRLTAEHTNRLMVATLLSEGRLVGFPFGSGQWELQAEGEVSDDYISRLELGPGTLERGLNLFDATRSPGRRIGPSARIPLGSALWVITRDARFAWTPPIRDVICREKAVHGGWHILIIELPSEASDAEMEKIGRWLGRDVREPRPRVWIERPYPLRVRSNGTIVLPAAAMVEFRSSRVVDFELTPDDRAQTLVLDRGATCAEWSSAEAGRWTLRADGVDTLNFELSAQPTRRPRPITAVLDNGLVCDVFELNREFAELARAGVLESRVHVSWVTPSISKIARISDGATIGETSTEVLARPGTRISFQNLGSASWPEPEDESAATNAEPFAPSVMQLARWLRAHARHDARGPVRLDVDFAGSGSSLARLTWDAPFAVHVRALARALRARQ